MLLRSRPRVVTALLLPAAILLAACGSGSGSQTASSGPVNIGVILPLTGPHAPAGTAWLDGAEAAEAEINANGGVLGGRQVKIVSESDGGDPIDAVTVARRMLASDGVSAVVGLAGSDYPNALPLIAQAHMVLFADVGDPALDSQTNPYVYRAVTSDALTGTAMAWEAQHAGYHNVALVFDAAEGAQTLVPPIEAAASKYGLNIISTNTSSLPAQAPSYQTAVQQIISAKPDALLLQLEPAGAGTFFQELIAQGGGNIPIIGSDSTSTSEWVKAIGATEASKELVSVVAATGEAGTQGQHFTSLFQQIFHTPPRTLSASNYDSVIVAALAMDAAHSTDPTTYLPYILKVTSATAGATTVMTYAQGLQLLNSGKQIKYSGISSPMDYNANHAITSAYQAVKTAPDGTVTIVGDIPATSLE